MTRTPGSSPPGSSPPRSSRPTAWVALVLGLVALAGVVLPVSPVLPVLVAIGVVAAGATDALVARRRRPEAERTPLPTLARGVAVPFVVRAELDGPSRPPEIRQPFPPELAVEPPAGRGAALESFLTGVHRGVHVLEPAVARVTGPLGLASADFLIGAPMAVTVLPDLPRARKLGAARRRGRATDEGRVRNRLGLGTELESIRDYSPDDDVRQINWVATARVGRPMSNQYRVDENRDLVCLVDTGRLMAAPLGDATRLDVALDAVAVLAVAAEDAGDRVGTVAFAGEVLRQLAPRRRGAEAVVRALFDLEPVEVDSAYDAAFQAVGGQKRALVVLFTDLMDEAAARVLVRAVPVLIRRHAVMVATCPDPGIEAVVQAEPAGAIDVYRSAVALDVLESRRRAATLLRAMGATVVESSPGRLGSACVSAYLQLKRAARL